MSESPLPGAVERLERIITLARERGRVYLSTFQIGDVRTLLDAHARDRELLKTALSMLKPYASSRDDAVKLRAILSEIEGE